LAFFRELPFKPTSIALSRSGENVLVASGDNQIQVWDSFSGYLKAKLSAAPDQKLDQVISSSLGLIVGFQYKGESFGLWDSLDPNPRVAAELGKPFSMELKKGIRSLTFTEDGMHLAMVPGTPGSTTIWNTKTWKLIHQFDFVSYEIRAHQKEGLIVQHKCNLYIFHCPSRTLVRTITLGDGRLTFLEPVDLVNRYVISAISGRSSLWDVVEGREEISLALSAEVFAIDPQEKLCACGDHSSITVWSIPDKKAMMVFSTNKRTFSQVFFSHDSRYLLAIEERSVSMMVWDLLHPKTEIPPFQLHAIPRRLLVSPLKDWFLVLTTNSRIMKLQFSSLVS